MSTFGKEGDKIRSGTGREGGNKNNTLIIHPLHLNLLM